MLALYAEKGHISTVTFMSFSKFLYICLAFLACYSKEPTPTQQKTTLLVSIAPYRLLTEKIAGPEFQVTTVVPAASNPHTFEPTASQVTKMGQSQIWLRIGEPFEKKLLPILKGHNPKLLVVDLREGIDLLAESTNCHHCSQDHLDRHIWLSPSLAKKQASLIEKALCQKFPEQSGDFHNNYLTLCKELDQLDNEIRETLKGVEKRTLLVSHAAFAYFCKDFELEQLSVEYEGKDPRPQHLDELLQKTGGVKVVLALPQHNNKGASLIATRQQLPLKYIDPYSDNYFDTMRELAKIIAYD